jgi:hypothetical protein|nr:MAG TPA: protein of unknown function (DUF5637) [Caudoviricetes sp.]
MAYNIFDAIRDTLFHPGDAFVEKEIALDRAMTCDTCPFKNMNICSRCGCFLPMKVRYKGSTCPEGKWAR